MKNSPFELADVPIFEVFDILRASFTPIFQQEFPDQEKLDGFRHFFPSEFSSFYLKLLDSGNGFLGRPYVIVGASDIGWDWYVIIFIVGDTGWQPASSLRLDGQKGQIKLRYIQGHPGALVLDYAGIDNRSYSLTTWYRVDAENFPPILSYPLISSPDDWGIPLDRTLEAIEMRLPENLHDGALLTLIYDQKHSMIFQSASFGTDRNVIDHLRFGFVFKWDGEHGAFVPAHAAYDPAKLDKRVTESLAEFISRKSAQLQDIKNRGSDEARAFVKTYLSPLLAGEKTDTP